MAGDDERSEWQIEEDEGLARERELAERMTPAEHFARALDKKYRRYAQGMRPEVVAGWVQTELMFAQVKLLRGDPWSETEER